MKRNVKQIRTDVTTADREVEASLERARFALQVAQQHLNRVRKAV